MTTPYYEDESVTLYHGDCRDVLASLGDRSVDCVITDPPYTAQVHAGARTRTVGARSNALVTFNEWTDDNLRETFNEFGRIVRRWLVATMAWDHAAQLHSTPPHGLRFVRLGAWVKHEMERWRQAGRLDRQHGRRRGPPNRKTRGIDRRMGASIYGPRRDHPRPIRWVRHHAPGGQG